MTAPSAHLDIRDPGVTDVLGDVDTLCLSELLRRARTPTEAGLAKRVKASARRRAPAWRTTREAIIVGYRDGDAADEAIFTALERFHGEVRRRTVEERAKTFKTRRADDEIDRGTIT